MLRNTLIVAAMCCAMPATAQTYFAREKISVKPTAPAVPAGPKPANCGIPTVGHYSNSPGAIGPVSKPSAAAAQTWCNATLPAGKTGVCIWRTDNASFVVPDGTVTDVAGRTDLYSAACS
jgi:hypothetical protein